MLRVLLFNAILLATTAVGGFCATARAAEESGGGVAAGGSIALPGDNTAVLTNPAGIAMNRNAKLSLQSGADEIFRDPVFRGGLVMGNGTIGAAALFDYRSHESRSDTSSAVYGLALHSEFLGLSIGGSGRTGIQGSSSTDYNVGLLFAPSSYLQLGATAIGMQGQIDEYGVGVAFGLVPGLDVVVDSGMNKEFKDQELKPGLRIGTASAGLSVSYGTGERRQFAKDVGANAYLRFGAGSEFELYYNHGGELPKYYAALSLGF